MERSYWLSRITQAFRVAPMVALLGPRQCGKTTLARQYSKIHPVVHHFDLENPVDLQRLQQPLIALNNLSGLIIIDEIQLLPDLFPVLRVLIDNPALKQRYLILGSASRDLIRQSSETLAGRIYHLELTPFNYREVHEIQRLWDRGGFPLSYLADTEQVSYEWRQQYITTFLERDIPSFGIKVPPVTLRRFWLMLAHYHGNIFNASELARSLGTNHISVRQYLDILSGTFMVRVLQPWHENIKKRQIKAPKIYFRDSGILHALLGVENFSALQKYPKLGSSWEGFAIEEVLQSLEVKPEESYFWGTHAEAGLDLLIIKNNKRTGFEFKFADAPKTTKSMHTAMKDLSLDILYVIYPGDKTYRLTEKIQVVGLQQFLKEKFSNNV